MLYVFILSLYLYCTHTVCSEAVTSIRFASKLSKRGDIEIVRVKIDILFVYITWTLKI